jgi:hypothetical protein
MPPYPLRRNSPSVLARLDPLVVQYFVHMSAGLPLDVPSLVVFAWDEANAIQDKTDGSATFFQGQLSDVMKFFDLRFYLPCPLLPRLQNVGSAEDYGPGLGQREGSCMASRCRACRNDQRGCAGMLHGTAK